MLLHLFALLGILLLLGFAEAFFHGRTLRKIPIRVHINGTRGKSSVTRLLSGSLREAGMVTVAKTTGTLARFITPAGKEYPIYRPAGANVGEQVRIVRTAATYNPDVLVIECMALQPSYQWLSEKVFVQATHGVITNARPDHLDVMGPGPEDVALALAGMTPRGGKLFTAERELLHIFKDSCADRNSELIASTLDDVAAITPADLEGFSYEEHPENIALVLKICDDLGVDRETAMRGMWAAPPDVGVLKAFPIDFFGREIIFVNALAANDPVSTERLWDSSIANHQKPGAKRIALFNCRADRPDRSYQLGESAATWQPADAYLLIGSGTHAFTKPAVEGGIDPEDIHYADGKVPSEIFEIMVQLADRSAIIVGMGNIGGPGIDLLRMVRNRARLEAA